MMINVEIERQKAKQEKNLIQVGITTKKNMQVLTAQIFNVCYGNMYYYARRKAYYKWWHIHQNH